MAEHNPQTPREPDANQPPAQSAPSAAAPDQKPLPGEAPAKPKRRLRRRLLIAAAALVLLLGLLIALIPTIASTAPARRAIVGQINGMLTGKCDIQDLSVGWSSGLDIKGVHVWDQNGAQVAEIGEIKSPLSLIGAAFGHFNLGDVQIDGLDFAVKRDASGNLNIAGLMKPSTSTGPVTVPDIAGSIHINKATGTIQDDQLGQSLYVDSLNVTLVTKDINQPLENHIDVSMRMGDKPLGRIDVDGTAGVIQNNIVSPEKLTGGQTVKLTGFDAAPLNGLVRKVTGKPAMSMAGVVNGEIAVKINSMSDLSAEINLVLSAASLGGIAPGGGTLHYDTLTISTTAGIKPDASNQPMVNADVSIVGAVKAVSDTMAVKVTNVPEQTFTNGGALAQAIIDQVTHAGGGGPATISVPRGGTVAVKVDVGNVAEYAKLVPSRPGTQVTGGAITGELDLNLNPGSASLLDSEWNVGIKTASATTRASTADIVACLKASQSGNQLLVNGAVQSDFLNGHIGRDVNGNIDSTAALDLGKLRTYLDQFVDLNKMLETPAGSNVVLSGVANLSLKAGDLLAVGKPTPFDASFDVTDLTISGIGAMKPIHQQKITGTLSAGLVMDAGHSPKDISQLVMKLDAPAGHLQASSDEIALDGNGKLIKAPLTFDVSADGHELQEQFAPLLPLVAGAPPAGTPANLLQRFVQRFAAGDTQIASAAITASGEINYDGKSFSTPKTITIHGGGNPSLLVKGPMGDMQRVPLKAFDVAINGTASQSADNRTISSVTATVTADAANGARIVEISGSADMDLTALNLMRSELHCKLDAGQGYAVLQPLLPILMPVSGGLVEQICAGNMTVSSGVVSLTGQATYIDKHFKLTAPLDVAASDIELRQKGVSQPILPKTLLHAVAAADVTQSDVATTIDIPTLQLTVNNTDLTLASDAKNPIHVTINKDGRIDGFGAVSLSIPDLAKLGLLNLALSAGSAAGVKPLTVEGGAVDASVNISGSGNSLLANVGGATIKGLALQRNGTHYRFQKDVSFSLAAAIEMAAGSGAVQKITVQKLSGDLGGAAAVNLAQPISISGFSAADGGDLAPLAAQASLTVSGDVAQLSRVMEALGGDPVNSYPYTGQLAYTLGVSKNAGQARLGVKGQGSINSYKVLDTAAGAPPLLSEDQVNLTTDFAVNIKDLADPSIVIDANDPVTIEFKSSQALALRLSGAVQNINSRRVISGGLVKLHYDVAKVWSIAQPLVPASQKDRLKDAKFAGVLDRQISVQGSVPADQPFNQAIKLLAVTGSLGVGNSTACGMTLPNGIELPFVLKDGHLRTVDAGKPEGLNGPPAAACNNGTLDIGVLNIDLTSPDMTVTMENASPDKPHMLMKNVGLTLPMTQLGFNDLMPLPIFSGVTAVQGSVDLKINTLKGLPLSAAVTQATSDNKGVADIEVLTHQMTFGSGLTQILATAGKMPSTSFTGDITTGKLHLEGGKLIEDVTVLVNGNAPMRINGTVILANSEFNPMTVNVPVMPFFGHMIPGNAARFMPDTVSFPLKGTMDHLQCNPGDVMQTLIKDAAKKALLNGILGG